VRVLPADIVDFVSDAVVVFDADRRVTLWNRAAEELFRIPASVAVGADAGSVVGHADPPTAVVEPWTRGQPASWQDELVIVRPDGGEVPVARTFTVLPGPEGGPGETVLVASSLTERRQVDAIIQRFSAILASSSETILSKTRSGIVTSWNAAAERMYGYPADEIVGHHVSLLVPEDRREELTDILDRVATGGSVERLETVRRRKDGSEAMVLLSVSPLLDEAGMVIGALTVASDLTERRVAEAELELAEIRFDGAFGTSAFGMAMADLVGRLTTVNPALCEILGQAAHDLVGHSLTDFAYAPPGAFEVPTVRDGLDSYSDERRYLHSDGSIVWLQVNVTLVRNLTGTPLYQMLQVLDITARKQLERELEHRALHDDLTGLANRALLNDRLEHALVSGGRSGRQVGVAFLDVDGFKHVNDALGHAAGDRLLVELSRRLVRAVRPEDTVARFGGDEFVILCTDVTLDTMEALADRVGRSMAQRFAVGVDEVSMHVSIGITVSASASTGQSMLSEADAAMFRAKELGRGRTAVFDDSMRVRAEAFLQGEQSLRLAIANHEVVAHYQPIVDLRDGRPLGVEALARWRHPTGSVVAPAQFIPLAESTGLIVRLGELMLVEATAAIAAWNRLSPNEEALWVSVNLSARQLSEPRLVETVTRALEASALPAHQLHLEVTETTLMEDVSGAVARLHELHELGVKVAIDDFGTGYSSLAYLRQFPVDTLKIDRSFVDGLASEDDDRSIVEAVVSLSRAMGLTCLAEGVETGEQLDVLLELGCELGQGFLWSPAMPAAEARRWMASRFLTS
jgi:diguanylate cyclase (GGDEF)-like protein/PAS domain S-box-containing protein